MSKERLEEIKEWHENDGEIHQFQIDWLIEQVERVHRLEKESAIISIQLRGSQLKNKRYREAIEDIKRTWESADNIYNHVEKIHEIIKALEESE
jgi:hypothetical protein